MIRSLISYPCRLNGKAIMATLREKIRMDAEEKLYRSYMARAGKYISENLAKMVGGGYMEMNYDEIISEKKKDTRTAEEIISDLKEKMRKFGKG